MADVNFIILKINGIDVSEMPNNEAVQMFLKAPEPMMLEVRRPTVDDLNKFYISSANLPIVSLSSPDKAPCCRHHDDDNDKNLSQFPAEQNAPDVLAGEANEEINRIASTKKYFITTGVQTDTVLTEYVFSGSSIGDQSNDHIFDECLSPEIDIEEVTLRKAASSEKLGLTVSYSSGSDDTDTCVEVYISDVIPNSVAGRDGRLRQGDQILQVNGRDVSNKTDTETLIAENKNAVTFLVSRYLYTDDDFNETYDDYDHRNLTYQNCSIAKNCPVDIRSSSDQTNTSSTSRSSSSHRREKKLPAAGSTNSSVAMTAGTTKEIIAKLDPINHFNIDAHLDSVNHELALLDSRVEGMMLHNGSKGSTVTPKPIAPTNQNQTTYIYRMPIDNMKKVPGVAVDSATIERTDVARSGTIVQSVVAAARAKKYIESDTEHIYETIPEDMESEPFYCLPYETADQNMVEQWLEMQAGNNEPATLPSSRSFPKIGGQMGGTMSKYSSGQQQLKATMKSNSSGEDHENSSSAYNTGGSSNSTNHMTLELNSNGDGYQRSIAGPYSGAINQQPHTDNIAQSFVQDINDNCEECQRQKKDKPLNVAGSPKHDRLKSPQKLRVLQKQQQAPSQQQSFSPFFSVITQPQCSADPSILTSPKIPADTMYTNMANLKRTMLLQQKLFRQALIRQNTGTTTSAPTATTLPDRPQFNAPNLSQYHFVSSQEVSAVTLKQYPCDEQMEWKVKRRQDGTRYIVRRPTRNRILRERAIRITAERNNDITTEDDTISEIKTGRYWTKDERKKHFERAKERRLRQQLNIFSKFESDNTATTIRQQSNEQQQQQQQKSIVSGGISMRCGAVQPPPAAMTPTIDSQTLYKKTIKKKKKDENATIADNDNKMMGLLSVTTV